MCFRNTAWHLSILNQLLCIRLVILSKEYVSYFHITQILSNISSSSGFLQQSSRCSRRLILYIRGWRRSNPRWYEFLARKRICHLKGSLQVSTPIPYLEASLDLRAAVSLNQPMSSVHRTDRRSQRWPLHTKSVNATNTANLAWWESLFCSVLEIMVLLVSMVFALILLLVRRISDVSGLITEGWFRKRDEKWNSVQPWLPWQLSLRHRRYVPKVLTRLFVLKFIQVGATQILANCEYFLMSLRQSLIDLDFSHCKRSWECMRGSYLQVYISWSMKSFRSDVL